MKRLLQHLPALALIVMSTVTVFAQQSKLYVEEFAIKKGEVKEISIYLDNPNYTFSAMQFDMYLSGGIKLVEENRKPHIYPSNRIPGVPGHIDEDDAPSFVKSSNWMKDGAFRYLFYNSYGLPVSGSKGVLFTMEVTTDETFSANTPAFISFKNVRLSDFEDTSTSFRPQETTTRVYQAKNLHDIFTADSEGTKCFIDETLKILAIGHDKSGQDYAFATDGYDHWIKLLFPDGNKTLQAGCTYSGGTIGGIVSDATLNPTITIEGEVNYEACYDDGAIFVDKPIYDFSQSMDLHPNQIIDITGHYFINSDGKPAISHWSGYTGTRGTTIEISTDLCPGVNFTEQQYHFAEAVVQLKPAKESPAGRPAMVAPSATSDYANYVIYPIVAESNAGTIITAINDINPNASVKSVRFINTAGIEAATPFSGINIVVTTYSDGTTRTTKIVK